jgi:molybdopterin converting factor small subunit
MKIRMPAELRELIEAAASESGASLNGEVVSRLEASFRSESLEVRIDELERKVSGLYGQPPVSENGFNYSIGDFGGGVIAYPVR